MAKLHAVLAPVGGEDTFGNHLPLLRSKPVASKEATTTNSMVTVPDIVVPAATGGQFIRLVWVLTATGGDVDVVIGPDPEAANLPGYRILSGTTREVFADAAGDKLAVKSVA